MNDPVQRCAECGSELPTNVPPGLCPSCTLKALKGVLELGGGEDSDSKTVSVPAPAAGERNEVAGTLADVAEVEAEVRHLLQVLSN